MSLLHSIRKRTLSQSSNTSIDHDDHTMLSTSAPSDECGQYFRDYDVDGKFIYSRYEKKPQLYDIDGKHRYKYFSQLRGMSKLAIPEGKVDKIGAKTRDRKNEDQSQKNSPRMAFTPPTTPPVTENVLYDIDGKFSYTVYEPSMSFGSYKDHPSP